MYIVILTEYEDRLGGWQHISPMDIGVFNTLKEAEDELEYQQDDGYYGYIEKI